MDVVVTRPDDAIPSMDVVVTRPDGAIPSIDVVEIRLAPRKIEPKTYQKHQNSP
jgi:hypothetical protein